MHYGSAGSLFSRIWRSTLMGWTAGLARASRRLARSTCSYNGLLSCPVCLFAKTRCFAKLPSHIRERARDCKLYPPNHTICDASCESHSLSIVFCDVSCKQLQDIRFCLGLCRSALVVWLMAFLALLFVPLPVNWRSALPSQAARFAMFSASRLSDNIQLLDVF